MAGYKVRNGMSDYHDEDAPTVVKGYSRAKKIAGGAAAVGGVAAAASAAARNARESKTPPIESLKSTDYIKQNKGEKMQMATPMMRKDASVDEPGTTTKAKTPFKKDESRLQSAETQEYKGGFSKIKPEEF